MVSPRVNAPRILMHQRNASRFPNFETLHFVSRRQNGDFSEGSFDENRASRVSTSDSATSWGRKCVVAHRQLPFDEQNRNEDEGAKANLARPSNHPRRIDSGMWCKGTAQKRSYSRAKWKRDVKIHSPCFGMTNKWEEAMSLLPVLSLSVRH